MISHTSVGFFAARSAGPGVRSARDRAAGASRASPKAAALLVGRSRLRGRLGSLAIAIGNRLVHQGMAIAGRGPIAAAFWAGRTRTLGKPGKPVGRGLAAAVWPVFGRFWQWFRGLAARHRSGRGGYSRTYRLRICS